jgi:hypothetical protein
MGNYYCLVAGLPDLLPDDQKLQRSLLEFKTELEENLSASDLKVISIFFQKFDNENLLKLLGNPEAILNPLGTLTQSDLLDIIQLFKDSDTPNDARIPVHFYRFMPAYLENRPLFQGITWEDQLTSLYFEAAVKSSNAFISKWFEFNLNAVNILTALNCRKFNFNVEEAIIGKNEIAKALRTSHSKDFGLTPIFSEIADLMRIADEDNLLERERKFDLLRWQWLEEQSVFNYFDLERIFVYLLKIEMLERWTTLDKHSGQQVFRQMIAGIQGSFEFPAEFKIKTVK